jgi:hypothetical protein
VPEEKLADPSSLTSLRPAIGLDPPLLPKCFGPVDCFVAPLAVSGIGREVGRPGRSQAALSSSMVGRVAVDDRFGGDASIWFLFIMWSELSSNFVYFIFVLHPLNLIFNFKILMWCLNSNLCIKIFLIVEAE